MLHYPSTVPLLAHHQVLCYCSLAVIVVLQSQTLERRTRVWLRKTIYIYSIVFRVDELECAK